mmetsp:Transcript_6750/g.20009  ORF Transcript_6750/g.20009 Transcript_6750/m.20009 type:complete len:267 (-) Transcript_6750:177-977(-)
MRATMSPAMVRAAYLLFLRGGFLLSTPFPRRRRMRRWIPFRMPFPPATLVLASLRRLDNSLAVRYVLRSDLRPSFCFRRIVEDTRGEEADDAAAADDRVVGGVTVLPSAPSLRMPSSNDRAPRRRHSERTFLARAAGFNSSDSRSSLSRRDRTAWKCCISSRASFASKSSSSRLFGCGGGGKARAGASSSSSSAAALLPSWSYPNCTLRPFFTARRSPAASGNSRSSSDFCGGAKCPLRRWCGRATTWWWCAAEEECSVKSRWRSP